MTFDAMTAGQASALLVGAAAIAAGLFLLKLRAPRMAAPSLLLWRQVLDSPRELTLWERIRRAVSLGVTVAVALLLALAVARPTRASHTGQVPGGRLLVVLDSSWSMQARTGTGETRWDRAVAEARRLFADAAGADIALGTTADGVIAGPTTDRSLVDAALERLSAAGSDRTAWPRLAGTAATHFITDGAMARPLDADVVVHSVFDPAPNVAIVAFEVRPSLSGEDAGDAYIEIANFAPSAQMVRVTLTRGGAAIFDRQIEMAANRTLRQVVPVARGGDAVLRARVQAERDALALDDEAVAWVERARPLAITVVGTRTGWLRRAFDGNPEVDATFIDPAGFEAGLSVEGHDPDAIVFDGWAPSAPPDRPALLFAPPAGRPWLGGASPGELPGVSSASAEERHPRWDVPGSHRVLLGVDPYTLVIDRARAYPSPDLVPIAISSRGTPLVYVTEGPRRRAVVVTFGPDESNLVSAPGFPVLLGNALEWLVRPSPLLSTSAPGPGLQAPLAAGLVAFDPAVLTVTDPQGRPIPLVRTGERAMGLLETPGLYVARGHGFASTLAVNAGDPELSNLARSTPIAATRPQPSAGGPSGHPWWVYCALAAFLLAAAEWWTWQRRITV